MLNSTELIKTHGAIESVSIENAHIWLKGWVISLHGESITGVKLSFGNHKITNFKFVYDLPSPDVNELFPTLPNTEYARFLIYVSLAVVPPEQFDNLIQLTPLINEQEGNVLFNFLESSLSVPEKDERLAVGGSFKLVACEFLAHFVNKAQLQPFESVLDAGCGVGRIAYSLAYYLDSTARYEGFDIVKKWIDWNQSVIHKRHPYFNFQWANIYSKFYNPSGEVKVENFIFPYPDAQFDFVFLTSVFTHLYAKAVYNYLQQIQRVMKPGGRCLCTFFLLNDESESLIKSGKSYHNLVYEFEDSFFSDLELPENAMGQRESLIMQWIEELGLTVSAKYYGLWSGRTSCISYQDILILHKPF